MVIENHYFSLGQLAGELLRFLPDTAYLRLMYRRYHKTRLNLANPEKFTEKLQWLKLHDRHPLYSRLVDKYEVKQIVSEKIGSQYVVPLLGVWDAPNAINWEKLPDKFVIKTTHYGGSSGVIVCKNKQKLDIPKAIKKLEGNFKLDAYLYGREWPYKNVKPRIIAEQLIEIEGINDIPDFKWYCFNGKPTYCQVIQNRSEHETIDFFDNNWQHCNFIGLNPRANNAENPPCQPSCLQEQLEIASILSKGIPFVRIDLYEANGKVYFGEYTFYPGSGLGSFRPSEYDKLLGNMIDLSTV